MTNTPIYKTSDGKISASIFENQSEKGSFMTATITNRYEKNGEWFDSNSYTADELLKLSNLALDAYNAVRQRKASNRTTEQQAA